MTFEDVETLRGRKDARDFSALCHAIVGAAWSRALGRDSVPEITDESGIQDQGIDARLEAPAGTKEDDGIVGPGWNFYQFKWCSVTRDRKKAVSTLAEEIKKTVPNLLAPGAPARYLILTNLNLRGADRKRLRAVFESLAGSGSSPAFVILGASEIASYLNNHPSLRHLFFATAGLSTLQVAYEDLRQLYVRCPWPSYIGRSALLGQIRTAVEAGPGLTLVHGSPYSGKTRLVLEALRPHNSRVRWTSDPDSVTLDLFRDMDAERNIVLVVDECTKDRIDRFSTWARGLTNLTTILIGSRVSPQPGARRIHVGEMTQEEMDELLEAITPGAPYLRLLWLKRIADGLPGLACHAGSLLRTIKIKEESCSALEDFLEGVKDYYLRDLGEDQHEALEAFSLLPSVMLDHGEDETLRAICGTLNRSESTVRFAIDDLVSRGLLRERDGRAEVTPTIVGDLLALRLYQRLPDLLAKALIELPASKATNLFERLRRLPFHGPLLEMSLANFFCPSGPFRDIQALASGIERFEQALPAAPVLALQAIERALAETTWQDLKSHFEGFRYHHLVNMLRILIETEDTFGKTAEMLTRLADVESEAEERAELATTFAQAFNFLNPRSTVPFSVRLSYLDKLSHSDVLERRLGAAATGEAIALKPFLLPETTSGPGFPPEPALPKTYDEVRDWVTECLRILQRLIGDPDEEVCRVSRVQIRERFADVLRIALDHEEGVPLGDYGFEVLKQSFDKAESASESNSILSELSRLKWGLENPDRKPFGLSLDERKLSEWTSRIAKFESDLVGTDWSRRLRRHAGPRVFGRWGLGPGASMREADERQREAHILAEEAIAQPELLKSSLEWLLSKEAENFVDFFRALGRLDTGIRPWKKLVLDQMREPLGPEAFGFYADGWRSVGKTEADEVERYLDSLSIKSPEAALPVISATLRGHPSERSVERLLRTARCMQDRLRDVVYWITWGSWADHLTPTFTEALTIGLDDGEPSTAVPLIVMLSELVERNFPLSAKLRDKSWELLERSARCLPPRDWRAVESWDIVAAKIGTENPERLARMVAGILTDKAAQFEIHGSGELSRSVNLLESSEHRDLFIQELLTAVSRSKQNVILSFAPVGRILQADRDGESVIRWIQQHDPESAARILYLFRDHGDAFLEFACRLVEATKGDERVSESLLSAFTSIGFYTGSPIPRLEQRRNAVRKALTAQRSGFALAWLRSADDALTSMIDQRARFMWDTEINTSELEEILRGRDAPLRRWALGRILGAAPPEETSRLIHAGLITLEDLRSTLDEAALSPAAHRRWKAYLESQSPVR